MCRNKDFVIGVISSLLLTVGGQGAERPDPKRWEADIAKLEAQQAATPLPPGGIIFVGSSSIRNWDLGKSFPKLPVANHGFGGSHLADSVYFADRLVIKYQPQVVVLYAGDNDMANGLTAEQVVEDYRQFVRVIKQSLPNTRIVYIPIKPSIARWNLYPEMARANREIRRIVENDSTQKYLEIEPAMLNKEGRPRKELFLEDGLHVNELGYAIWADKLRPMLDELLATPSASQSRKGEATKQ